MNKIAIVVVTYNRIHSVKRLLKSLEQANYGDEEPTLIISIDKSDTNLLECFADEYEWPHGEKIVRKHEKNLGLRPHMMSLGEWFDDFDTLIVLEDDIIVSPCFYLYARQASDMYMGSDYVCGISLYAKEENSNAGLPFAPIVNEFDGYFMNYAISWGEVWMKPQWLDFYNWYKKNENFTTEDYLPANICTWGKSWLKYHIRYCIEKNKYFLFPYVSLTTNSGASGTHIVGSASYLQQVRYQTGNKTTYKLPRSIDDAVCYDGFHENKKIYKHLGIIEKDLCVDIYGKKNNYNGSRYILSTKVLNYEIVHSYGFAYRPIEMNVIKNQDGDDIFLYDTTVTKKNQRKGSGRLYLFLHNVSSALFFVKAYGMKNLINEVFTKIHIRK